MNHFKPLPSQQTGVTMIEVLVSLAILLVGLLGLAGLQVQAQRSEVESYQRVQALVLLQDMVGRINANRKIAATGCYATGSNFLGTSATATPACTSPSSSLDAQATQAVQDMNDWSDLLAGAAESVGGANVGAMVGARGCISYDSTTQTYFISIAWQGLGKTASPPSGQDCAQGQYGDDALRRVVSTNLRIANLSAP